jgi:AcrR family transcriptional regulator
MSTFDRPFSHKNMSPRTKEQFEEIREGKRRQILDSAIECFAEHGYHTVSISHLAKHAGISKGLLYNYFTSKDELLRAILMETYEILMSILDPEKTGRIAVTDIRVFFTRFFDHLTQHILTWRMYLAIFSQPAVQQILYDDIQDMNRQTIVIEEYFRQQGFENPAMEVAFLSTLTSGVMFEYLSDPEHYPLEEMKERIIRLYENKKP